MRGNSCRCMKQWRRLPQEVEPQGEEGQGGLGCQKVQGGFHLSQGWSLPRPDFWLLIATKPQETRGDASEGALLPLKTVSGVLRGLPWLSWEKTDMCDGACVPFYHLSVS